MTSLRMVLLFQREAMAVARIEPLGHDAGRDAVEVRRGLQGHL